MNSNTPTADYNTVICLGNHHKVLGPADEWKSMSDTANEDYGFLGRQLLKKSQTEPLRRRMEEFVAEHEVPDDLASLRSQASGGKDVSEIAHEDRDERL